MSGIEDVKPLTVVVIVSSNYLLRLGLQKIVDAEQWIRLIGQTTNGASLDELLTYERPHIAILDTETESTIPDLMQKIKRAAPGVKTILLSGFDETECTRQAFVCGVDGIVLKVQPSAVLIAMIAHLARPTEDVGLTGAGPATRANETFSTDLAASIPGPPSQAKRPDGLTEREREVVRWIGEGLSNKDIADRLCISSITVRHHLTSIFDKLGVSNRQKLLIRAHQNGLTRPPALA